MRYKSDLFYRLYIRWMMASSPAKLFGRLYQLNWYRRLHENWVNGLQGHPGDILLEVGCGPGLLAQYLAKSGYIVEAVDRSKSMIKAAEENANVLINNNAQLKFSKAEIDELPFQDGQFDFVIAASVLNIVSNAEAAIEEMKRVLNVGGKISFLLPSELMTLDNIQKYSHRKKLRGFSAVAMRSWSKHSSYFDQTQCLELCESAQLSAINIERRLGGMIYSVTAEKTD